MKERIKNLAIMFYLLYGLTVFFGATLTMIYYIHILESNIYMKIFELIIIIIAIPSFIILLLRVYKNEML